MSERRTLRCAVYTRKSTEEGLDQDFSSLDAQREACEAYIKSQTHEGWTLVRNRFDDGGYSGGTMERPGLQALLEAIRERQVDVAVVYKIDRLTRSLTDFSRIVEVFEAHGASFVSVTQAFNTTTSMGRLTLNVLLSFAQFEREVTAERIRDKIAASKRKGMWMGGPSPLGYDVKNRGLVVNPAEAETVRTLFRLYLERGSVREVQQGAAELGLVTKLRPSASGRRAGGGAFSRGHLYAVLGNPLYVGRVAHRGETHPGQHAAIVEQIVWDAVQAKLAGSRPGSGYARKGAEPSLLTGLVFDDTGDRLSPSHAIKAGRRYRYYISRRLTQAPRSHGDGWRLPARELEKTIIVAVAGLLRDQIRLVTDLQLDGLRPDQIRATLSAADSIARIIASMSPAELRPLLAGIIRRIDLLPGAICLRLSRSGLCERLVGNAQLPHQNAIGPGTTRAADREGIDITVSIGLRRRGVEARFVLRDGHTPATAHGTPDPTLIKLLRNAHRALALLTTGGAGSLSAISREVGLDRSDLSQITPLAFLAPDIVAAILHGRQPTSLTANRLKLLCPLPVEWNDQRRLLGFPHPAGESGAT